MRTKCPPWRRITGKPGNRLHSVSFGADLQDAASLVEGEQDRLGWDFGADVDFEADLDALVKRVGLMA